MTKTRKSKPVTETVTSSSWAYTSPSFLCGGCGKLLYVNANGYGQIPSAASSACWGCDGTNDARLGVRATDGGKWIVTKFTTAAERIRAKQKQLEKCIDEQLRVSCPPKAGNKSKWQFWK